VQDVVNYLFKWPARSDARRAHRAAARRAADMASNIERQPVSGGIGSSSSRFGTSNRGSSSFGGGLGTSGSAGSFRKSRRFGTSGFGGFGGPAGCRAARCRRRSRWPDRSASSPMRTPTRFLSAPIRRISRACARSSASWTPGPAGLDKGPRRGSDARQGRRRRRRAVRTEPARQRNGQSAIKPVRPRKPPSQRRRDDRARHRDQL